MPAHPVLTAFRSMTSRLQSETFPHKPLEAVGSLKITSTPAGTVGPPKAADPHSPLPIPDSRRSNQTSVRVSPAPTPV